MPSHALISKKVRAEYQAMKARFNEQQLKQKLAAHPQLPPALAVRIYTAHLIGQELALMVHGDR
jgi:hypothetical protein